MERLRWLVYSNIWVAFAAPSMLWFGALASGERPDVGLYVFVFSATLFTYNIQRLYKAGDYLAPDALDRHRWIWEHRRALHVLTLSAGLCTFICLFFVNYLYLLWLAPAALVSAFYFIPFYGDGRRKRLRDIPFLKIALVAFVWSWIAIACPALMLDKPVTGWIGLMIFQALFAFGLTVPFDIRDAGFDAREGTKTFVSQWGMRPAKIFSTACFVLALPALYFSSAPRPVFWAMVPYMALAGFAAWFASPRRHEMYYGFWLDGFFLFQGPVAYTALWLWEYVSPYFK